MLHVVKWRLWLTSHTANPAKQHQQPPNQNKERRAPKYPIWQCIFHFSYSCLGLSIFTIGQLMRLESEGLSQKAGT